MSALTRLSLRNRALIALITVVAAVFGVVAMTGARQELMPDVELPIVVVQSTEAGVAPDVVDTQISTPIETAVQSVEGIESTSSTSTTGSSTVTVEFAFGTDRVDAEQKVRQAVSRISAQLPDGLDPVIASGSTSDMPVVMLAASSSTLDPVDVADRVRENVTADIERLDGVAQATVMGGGSREIRVTPDPEALQAHGLTAASITQALQADGVVAGAGQVTDGDLDLSVRVGSRYTSTDDVADLPLLPAATSATTSASSVSQAGATATSAAVAPVRLGDVAAVELVQAPQTGISRVDGEPAVTIQVTKKAEGNTVAVSRAIADDLATLQANAGDDVSLSVIYDQAPSIEQSISSLTTEGMLGLVFAVLVILVFLLSARSTLVTAISIPLSLLITFIGIEAVGYSLNVLTLGALTIAIGRVVDDAIVVIENINRHMEHDPDGDRARVILRAVREVAGAITASTLTTAAVFLPVGFVGGVVGELFRPFAFTVVIALLASLLVALTIVPVLAYWFLRARRHAADTGRARGDDTSVAADAGGRAASADPVARRERDHSAVLAGEERTRLQRGYEPVLRGVLAHPWVTVIAAVAVLGATLALTPLMQTNFIGDSGETTASVTQRLPSGTSLEAAQRRAEPLESALRDVAGVETVATTIGSSGGLTAASFLGGGGADSTSFQIAYADDADAEQVQQDLRAVLNAQPDADDLSLSTSGASGVSNDVTIDVTAPDDERLAAATDVLMTGLQDVDDVAGIESSLASDIDTVHVAVRRDVAAEHGMTEAQIIGAVSAVMNPQQAATAQIDSTDVSIVVREADQPQDVDALRALTITTPTGDVRLDTLADVTMEQVPRSISSERGRRSATITITPAGESLNTVSAGVSRVLDETELPAGADAAVGGVLSEQSSAFRSLGLALLAAILIVYVIMVATFRSLRQPLLLLVSIPFAATGALAALLITGTPLGAASLVGLLMLVGIVVTNAIVLIDLVNQFRARGMAVHTALLEGASRRLRPILMTAAATVFALLPMALGITGHGGFISQPLALVVIGGLVSSTLLTLAVLPALYWLVEGHAERRAARHAASAGPVDSAETGTADPE
ncbi:efflux RND transporter permease subunit [Pseudoclavibacter caeni]|uniref:Efflux RND transporter permease subunit n=1 Tax=Pseudoclavibacter caeni TaxID=908846 RepID=A0A7C8FWR5_9MICO|nr:efflux RND transporter permease subunit [Pseudoclavibacter caeni]KAB1631536.1 efflux RND transporter permease subunit [Pseudoclavibacter caeni]NYJ97869.1 HAE1 family hydrophobic/amphiphilic exporter-1 [Pseudoclavibacter caeni]